MRKPHEIGVIVHYPTTFFEFVSYMKQVVYADPRLIFERIVSSSLAKDKKVELLALAQEKANKYSHNDLIFYQRSAMPHKD